MFSLPLPQLYTLRDEALERAGDLYEAAAEYADEAAVLGQAAASAVAGGLPGAAGQLGGALGRQGAATGQAAGEAYVDARETWDAIQWGATAVGSAIVGGLGWLAFRRVMGW